MRRTPRMIRSWVVCQVGGLRGEVLERMRHLRNVWLLAAALLAVGCSDELDPAEAGDAYLMFRDAMWAGSAEQVWAMCDVETHTYFQERYDELVAMDETIDRYLPLADHRLARRQSGAVLTKEIKDGKGLFLKVFTPDKLPKETAYKLGTDVEELAVSEDDQNAKIVTRGKQTFYLVKQKAAKRGEPARWHVKLVQSSEAVPGAFSWLEGNRVALQQTVDDLIAEERQQREAIIAELMTPGQ